MAWCIAINNTAMKGHFEKLPIDLKLSVIEMTVHDNHKKMVKEINFKKKMDDRLWVNMGDRMQLAIMSGTVQRQCNEAPDLAFHFDEAKLLMQKKKDYLKKEGDVLERLYPYAQRLNFIEF